MTTILCFIISGLLFLNAFQAYMHERAMEAAERRWSSIPPAYFEPTPPPEPVYLLEKRLNDGWGSFGELAPTRRLSVPIHPPFRAYGTDISVTPTIGVY